MTLYNTKRFQFFLRLELFGINFTCKKKTKLYIYIFFFPGKKRKVNIRVASLFLSFFQFVVHSTRKFIFSLLFFYFVLESILFFQMGVEKGSLVFVKGRSTSLLLKM